MAAMAPMKPAAAAAATKSPVSRAAPFVLTVVLAFVEAAVPVEEDPPEALPVPVAELLPVVVAVAVAAAEAMAPVEHTGIEAAYWRRSVQLAMAPSSAALFDEYQTRASLV
jgi:hypothetical protein